MKISVVLAAYKGEKYITEQIASILPQLGENDEVIVSDDYPQGETKDAVLSFDDNRIKYIEGPAKGVTANFGYAMEKAQGDVIFLCDQDDVWMPDKVSKVMAAIESGADLVLHDSIVTDGELNTISPSFFAVHGSNNSYVKNIIRNSFVGCCMAFTKEVMAASMPMPADVPMHDWWIALVAIKKGYNVQLLNEPLIKWRRHGDNVTGGSTSAMQKIKWRLTIIRNLITVRHGKVM